MTNVRVKKNKMMFCCVLTKTKRLTSFHTVESYLMLCKSTKEAMRFIATELIK